MIEQRFFAYLEGARFKAYKPLSGELHSQLQGGSCVAASARMILTDHDQDQPEAYIRDALSADDRGAWIEDLPAALRDLGLERQVEYLSGLSLGQLRDHTTKYAAVASVKLAGYGVHALVVDGFNGDFVCIRDPLPPGAGSAYAVHQDDFANAWNEPRGNKQKQPVQSVAVVVK